MKIGVIIPTRGDRPLFIKNCLLQLARQTILPAEIALMDYVPESALPDITQRYRRGYDQLRNKGLDIIALIEDDDWYANDYLETMASAWDAADRPDLFGTTYTIYYHMKLFAHWTFNHHQNSHALSTLIRPDMKFEWCPDYEAFTDKHLFTTLNYKLWTPGRHICLGMKHGVGQTGGLTHVHKLHRFVNQDPNKKFIRDLMDDSSFEFFSTYFLEGNALQFQTYRNNTTGELVKAVQAMPYISDQNNLYQIKKVTGLTVNWDDYVSEVPNTNPIKYVKTDRVMFKLSHIKIKG